MEEKKNGLAGNLEAASPENTTANEEERLDGERRATQDLDTWGYSEAIDERPLEAYDDDCRRDIVEEYLEAQEAEMFRELFKGYLSPEVLKAAFKVTIS